MSYIHPAWIEYQRRRFARPDAKRWVRPDAARFQKPDFVYGSLVNEKSCPLHWDCKFDPGQPRVPAGSSDGGQWTNGSVASVPSSITDPRVLSDAEPGTIQAGMQYAQARPRTPGSVIINGQQVEMSPGQAARLAEVQSRAEAATERVREVDRNWKATPSSYNTVEGLIRAYRSDAEQAQARVSELATYGIGPGPFACESIPARGPDRNFSVAEREWALRSFKENGCHTCGTREAGTPSGNPVLDHQPLSALNFSGRPQRLYTQCLSCSLVQGGWGRYFRMRW